MRHGGIGTWCLRHGAWCLGHGTWCPGGRDMARMEHGV